MLSGELSQHKPLFLLQKQWWTLLLTASSACHFLYRSQVRFFRYEHKVRLYNFRVGQCRRFKWGSGTYSVVCDRDSCCYAVQKRVFGHETGVRGCSASISAPIQLATFLVGHCRVDTTVKSFEIRSDFTIWKANGNFFSFKTFLFMSFYC